MIDIVKDVEVVSLPLRFAMIAHRADVALERVEHSDVLRKDDKRALRNAIQFLTDASLGKRIRDSQESAYEPLAICAYEMAVAASTKANVQGREFITKFTTELNSLLKRSRRLSKVSEVRAFFQHLAEWCLDQGVSEFEQVRLEAQ